MARFVFLLLFVTVFAAAAITLRACSMRSSADDFIPASQAEKIAVLQDGSVLFAPDGTVARELTEWPDQPDGDARWFELGGTQFLGLSITPTPFIEKRLPRLAQMMKAYSKVAATLVGHVAAMANADDDRRVSQARADWTKH